MHPGGHDVRPQIGGMLVYGTEVRPIMPDRLLAAVRKRAPTADSWRLIGAVRRAAVRFSEDSMNSRRRQKHISAWSRIVLVSLL